MGLGKKSHGAKEHKETQSPVLKIFKDIMQRENTDPEKVTLLKDKQKKEKKKILTRPKYEQKSYDSSSTDRYGRGKQHKITVQGVKEEKPTEIFQGEKKDSWWFKRDKTEKERGEKADDTCSCVSCALKKLIGSEYICVGCLLVLFTMSVVVAFLMVFRSPSILETSTESGKKMQLIKRQLNDFDGSSWKTPDPQYSGYLRSGLAETKLHGSNALEDLDGISSDLSSVLGSDKLAEGQNSERLRDFYKKLLQTDAQIKKLKESLTHSYQTDADIKSISDSLRFKRSIDRMKKTQLNNNPYKHSQGFNTKEGNDRRFKRYKDNSTKLSGFVVEKEKVYIKYEPIQRRNFPKCYHTHDGRYHEKKLKHPFYKNSQRLDEMLYQIDGKTTKDISVTRNYHTLKPHPNTKYRFKNNNNDYIEKDIDYYSNMPNNMNMTFGRNLSNMSPDYFENKQVNIPQSTLETIFNAQTFKTAQGKTKLQKEYGRKLLQVNDEDDETLGYDDLKEVLADDQDTHDDMDKVERKKRKYDNVPTNFIKYNPSPSIYNPNWKGPMPLYPDEINAMIKQAALHNLNIQVPIDTKDIKIEKDKAERDITDTEYIEDYLDDKYNRLVNMAQAYSDYGVLDAKQDANSASTKGSDKPEEGFKIFERGGVPSGPMERNKKEILDPEGVRFEYKPGTMPSITEKNEVKTLLNSMRKHIKFVKPCKTSPHPVPPKAHKAEIESDISPNVDDSLHAESAKTDGRLVYTLKKPARSLKSIDEDALIDNLKLESIFEPNKSGKHFNFIIKKPLRSLKSIEDNNEDVNSTEGSIKHKEEKINKDKMELVNKTTSFDIGEFLGTLADWFFSMAQLSGEMKSNTTVVNNISKSDDLNNNRSELSFPTYDADMIENIGHRSRVLMALDDNATVTTEARVASNTTGVQNATLATINKTRVNPTKKISGQNKNRTLVKRSVPGNNFIFWNDLYDDDEYGMKVDYLDNVIRGKHFAKYDYRNALVRSKDWVQRKLRTITDRLKEDLSQKSKSELDVVPAKLSARRSRRVRSVDGNSQDVNIRKSFAVLNANLKHVCRQAAEAVRNTRKIHARDEDQEATQATGLMQQLVRLMSDLVDVQVQQKTCAKLPPDLREFLEWLTAPSETHPQVEPLPALTDYSRSLFHDDGRFEKSSDFGYDLPTLTEDTHQDDRTECLGSIRAVQDLIQQYDGMTDEDKSKMAGVREYLENQLEFLNRKLNSLSEYVSFNYKREARDKRSLKKPRFRRLFDRYTFIKHKKTTKTTTLTTTVATEAKSKKHKATKAKSNKKEKEAAKQTKKDKEHKSKQTEKKIVNELKVNITAVEGKEKKKEKKHFEGNANRDLDFQEDLDGLDFPDGVSREERNLKDIYFRALDEARKTTVKKN